MPSPCQETIRVAVDEWIQRNHKDTRRAIARLLLKDHALLESLAYAGRRRLLTR